MCVTHCWACFSCCFALYLFRAIILKEATVIIIFRKVMVIKILTVHSIINDILTYTMYAKFIIANKHQQVISDKLSLTH